MRFRTSSRSSAWTVFTVISLIVLKSLEPVAGSGATWQTTPPSTLARFVGDDLFLEYEYNTPHYADPRCRFSLGYYAGGSTEDVLVRGYLDPTTGGVDVEEQLYLDRLNVTSYPGGFTFHVGNLSLSDSGQYLVDICFSLYDYLHHPVVFTVYNRPRFLTSPSPTNVTRKRESNVTMSWTLSDLPSQPAIDSLQIKHTVQDVNYTLVDQRLLPDAKWTVSYPEEQLRFKRRILYTPGPNLESVNLNIKQLELDDSGIYIVEIVYKNDAIKLQDAINLHVLEIPFVTDFAWISVPSDPTYIVESSERTLIFTAHLSNKTDLIPKYELSRMTRGDDRELLASMVINEDNTPKTIESIWNPDWTFSYNSSSSSVLVKISNIQMQDAGRYTFDLRNGSAEILAHNQFTIFVLNDSSLNPEIKTSVSDDDIISLTIRCDRSICTPFITLYDESGSIYGFTSANTMVTRIPRTEEQVLVVVEYECDDFHHKIRRPLNLSAFAWTGKGKAVSGAESDDLLLFPTTTATIDTHSIAHSTLLPVTVGLGIISSVLVCLLLVYIFYKKRRPKSHSTEAKTKRDSPRQDKRQPGHVHGESSDYDTKQPTKTYVSTENERISLPGNGFTLPLHIHLPEGPLPTELTSLLTTQHFSEMLDGKSSHDKNTSHVPVMKEESAAMSGLPLCRLTQEQESILLVPPDKQGLESSDGNRDRFDSSNRLTGRSISTPSDVQSKQPVLVTLEYSSDARLKH